MSCTGPRRTLAAVEAGRATVPVYVVDVPDAEKAREIYRLVTQLAEKAGWAPSRPASTRQATV